MDEQFISGNSGHRGDNACCAFWSVEAVKTALDMMTDLFPQAGGVDPREVVEMSFVKQVEPGR